VEECGQCPVFASFTLAFALQLRKKHGKTSFRVRKTSVRVRKTSVRVRKTSARVQYKYYQKYSIHITKSTVHILPKVQYTYYQKYSIHITKILPNTCIFAINVHIQATMSLSANVISYRFDDYK